MENNTRRWWDILAIVLLLLALWASAFRLEVTHWTDNLNRVDLLVTIGYVLGVLIGLSIFQRKTVYWLAAAYTLFFLPWQIGSTVDSDASWAERLVEGAQRIGVSFTAFFRNQPNTDTILFLALMALLFWFIGITAGYMMARHGKPWIPLAGAGLTLFIVDFNHSFLANRYSYSGVFVLLVLLLLGRMYFLRSRREWVDTGVSIDFETGFSLGRSMVAGGLLLVLVSWNLPRVFESLTPGTAAHDKFSDSWQGLKDRISNAFSGLDNPVMYVSDTFSSTMSLGNGAVLGEENLFSVETSAAPDNFRFYWRGFSYDTYDGKQWQNNIDSRVTVSLDEWPVSYPEFLGRRKVEMVYTMKTSASRVIYVPSMVLSLDMPATLVVDDSGGEETVDVISALSNTPLGPGDTFEASAWVSTPTIKRLREAGQEYPEWVQDRYLQLPDDFSERVRALAEEVAGDEETTYDQVMAITRYLREEIEYQETVDDPPADSDIIEWFLFDYKKGFCNYYASAEVLMLRSLGIPARIAVGFAQGQYDDVNGIFDVRMNDSHAWPEVFFPGTGWVEFEPTAIQPETALPEGNASNDQEPFIPFNPLSESAGGPDSEAGASGEIEEVDVPEPVAAVFDYRGLYITLAIILAAALGFVWVRKNRDWLRNPFPVMLEKSLRGRGIDPPRLLQFWLRQIQLTPMERMFEGISWMLWLLGRKVEDGETPAEQTAALVESVPAAAQTAGILLDEYHRAEYSRQPYDLSLARSAYVDTWRTVISTWTKRIINVTPG